MWRVCEHARRHDTWLCVLRSLTGIRQISLTSTVRDIVRFVRNSLVFDLREHGISSIYGVLYTKPKTVFHILTYWLQVTQQLGFECPCQQLLLYRTIYFCDRAFLHAFVHFRVHLWSLGVLFYQALFLLRNNMSKFYTGKPGKQNPRSSIRRENC